MNFDFLNEINASTESVTNKRGSSDLTTDPVIKTTSTTGNISLNNWAMKVLGATDGDRIVIAEVPEGIPGVAVSVEKTGITYLVGKGTLSNVERLEEEYDLANPHNFAPKSAEAEAHEAAKAEFVTAELEARGLADNSHNGAKIRATGSGYQFSSRNPWALLGGNTEGSNYYDTVKAYGLASVDGQIVLITDENKDTLGDTQGIGMLNSADNETIWAPAENLEAALENPFLVLVFSKFVEKHSRGNATGAEETTNAGEEVAAVEEAVEAPSVELDDTDIVLDEL